jgi:hypothetical protein
VLPLLGSYVTPTADKDEDLRVNGLIQSQNWPIGFNPSREVVVWDQGDEIWDEEDGVSPFPLGVYSPDMPLDWTADREVDEVLLLPILDASVSKEELHRETMVAHQKTKGRADVLNLKSSINYDNDYATS